MPLFLASLGGVVAYLGELLPALGASAFGLGRILLVGAGVLFGVKFLPGANQTADILSDKKTLAIILVVAAAGFGLFLGRRAQRKS